jgi:glycosyltransferase involved in cell wall biosynthesis
MASRPGRCNGRRLALVVDGVVYGFQRHGGINTFFNEVLPRLSKRLDISIAVQLPDHCEGKLPRMAAKVWQSPFPHETGLSWKLDQVAKPLLRRANILAAKLRLWQFTGRSWPYVFQSTYFTLNDEPVPQVGLALDMNHEIFVEFFQNDWGQSLRRQYREYLQRATRIIAISQNTKQDVIRIYRIPSDNIDVVYLAVDRDVFRAQQSKEVVEARRTLTHDCEPYILFLGRRDGYKNFDRLLEAFGRASIKNRVCLVVVGTPWQSGESRRIRDLGLDSRVRLVAYPSDQLLAALYNGALAFIYPSLGEGFGIPLLEAMACETLVLAADIPVFREVAGEAAIYFDPYQPEDIARVLEIAASNLSRTEYISRGTQQVAKYSWDKCAEQTYHVYRKALELWSDERRL